jgi:two-component system LytT family response regulator
MATPLKALIVDDEPIARQVLREELELIEEVEILGEADDGASALKQIASLRPDLVFLDLQMPGMGGLEVVQRVKRGSHLPVIVIVTAYDQYAIQAFEAGAVDYLLKPIRQERLAEAVDRARRLRANSVGVAEHLAQLQELAEPAASPRARKIVGRSGEEYVLLDAREVYAFQADGDLVWILTSKKKYLAAQSLKSLQKHLQNTSFRRIHRKMLVNIDHIRKMSALSSQRWLITLGNGQEFVVSKRLARNVRQLLSW